MTLRTVALPRDSIGRIPIGRLPIGAELEFLRRLWRLNRALALVSARLEREVGITAQQRMMIRCIGRYPGMTAGHLAAELHLDRGTVSAAIRRLEARALVHRMRDPRDKRRVTLWLAREGRALDRPREGTVEAAVTQLHKSVDDKTLNATLRALDALTALLAQ
jgi:DNA-binding MarR family transcriptional regulator